VRNHGELKSLVKVYYTENLCYVSEKYYNDISFSNQEQLKNFIDVNFKQEE